MAKSPYRKPELKDLADVSRTELIAIVHGLVASGRLSVEVVNSELGRIREIAREKAIAELETEKRLSPEQQEELLRTVETRFLSHMERHEGFEWAIIQAKLEASHQKMLSLYEMEMTGGEPDIVGYDENEGEYIFIDCSAEGPKGRQNTCYDMKGQKVAESIGGEPAGNAVDMANAMGIELLTPEQYREFQQLGEFDRIGSTWLKTPLERRKKFDEVFVGVRTRLLIVSVENLAPSVYGSFLSFRGLLRV